MQTGQARLLRFPGGVTLQWLANVQMGKASVDGTVLLDELNEETVRDNVLTTQVHAPSEILGYFVGAVDGAPAIVRLCLTRRGHMKVGIVRPLGAPSSSMLSEAEYERAFALLDLVPSPLSLGDTYDPRTLICAVNYLHGLGRSKAIEAIREFLVDNRVDPRFMNMRRFGIYYVLRLLFELPPEGYMPELAIGQFSWWPDDPHTLPLFPLVLIDDIPFLVAGVVELNGTPREPSVDLGYMERTCRFRSRPLSPARDPLSVVRRLIASGQLVHYNRAELERQALLLCTDTDGSGKP